MNLIEKIKNGIKKKAFGLALKFLKNKIKGAGPEINEIHNAFYVMSIAELLIFLTNKISTRDIKTISFMSYLKELDNPMNDTVERYLDAAIDGLDPREK